MSTIKPNRFPRWSRCPRMACLHPWARRPPPRWRAWVNCAPSFASLGGSSHFMGFIGLYWDISWLVGGLEHFLFSHILANWLSYFSEGWPNHQPDAYSWFMMVSDCHMIIMCIFRMVNPLLWGSLWGIVGIFREVCGSQIGWEWSKPDSFP